MIWFSPLLKAMVFGGDIMLLWKGKCEQMGWVKRQAEVLKVTLLPKLL